MKSFSTAYYTSRKESKEEQSALIEQERIQIVSALKKEYGFSNAAALSEAEQRSYRSMLNEMWTRETGLTNKGISFLKEGCTNSIERLTNDSTDEQIMNAFKKELGMNIISLFASINSDTPNFEAAAKAKKCIEDKVGRKLNVKDCKDWMKDAMKEYVEKKVNKFKF